MYLEPLAFQKKPSIVYKSAIADYRDRICIYIRDLRDE